MSLRTKVLVGFSVICLIWGSSWAAVKLGIESVPPLLSLGIRLLLASIILGVMVLLKHLTIPAGKKFWTLVGIMCVTSFTVPFVLIYWGQLTVDSGLSAVLFATYPFWVALVSHFLLPEEKITSLKIIGMSMGFIGVLLIFNNGFADLNLQMMAGFITIILGAIIQAFGLVFLRKMGEEVHPVTLNFYSMSVSALPLFAASYFIEDYSNIHFDSTSIGAIAYLSVFCTVMTFVIYFWLVKHVEAVVLSLSALITPVIAVLIGIIFMGEYITRGVIVGSLLV
ncbi:MAG: hypothetical protein EHM64_16025, partial [Ignavibacteriae bacterium]